MSAMAPLRAYALRRSLKGFRLLAPLGIALMPTLIAVMFVNFRPDSVTTTGFDLYKTVIVPLNLYFVLSFVAMFGMLPVLAELYAKGRIGYLYTRPVPRWVPLVGLMQGAWLGSLPALMVGALLPAPILAMYAPDTFHQPWLATAAASCAILALGSMAYGAIFLFLGVWSKRSVIWALFISVIWGSVVGSLPGSMREWSLHHYLFGLAREWCDVKEIKSGAFPMADDPPGTVMSLTVLFGVTAIFLLLSWQVARRRDVM